MQDETQPPAQKCYELYYDYYWENATIAKLMKKWRWGERERHWKTNRKRRTQSRTERNETRMRTSELSNTNKNILQNRTRKAEYVWYFLRTSPPPNTPTAPLFSPLSIRTERQSSGHILTWKGDFSTFRRNIAVFVHNFRKDFLLCAICCDVSIWT